MLGGKGVSRSASSRARTRKIDPLKQPNSEEKFFRYLGANIRRVDILSRDKRILNLDELRQRIKPDEAAAEQHFKETVDKAQEEQKRGLPWTQEKQHAALALSEGLLEDYLASDAQFLEDVIKPLDRRVNFLSLPGVFRGMTTWPRLADRESLSISQRTGGYRSRTTTGETSQCRKRQTRKQVWLSVAQASPALTC